VQAAAESLQDQGYGVITAVPGDFDGDGLTELAASIADPAIHDEEESLRRSEIKDARSTRVVFLKPHKLEFKPRTELPSPSGTGYAAAYSRRLSTVDLVEDKGPELFATTHQPMMGNTGVGDAYVYTHRGAAVLTSTSRTKVIAASALMGLSAAVQTLGTPSSGGHGRVRATR